ncbi:MAG: hypothetical protein GY841_13750 [FCB group bacterium]|nr:hypothetical protein [FCB group bacterium]
MRFDETRFCAAKVTLIIGLLSLGLAIMATQSVADNSVGAGFQMEGTYDDTIWAGVDHLVGIYIQNTDKLRSMSLGFKLFSPDGVEWTWVSQAEGYGPGGKYTGLQAATVFSGWRMDPAEEVWDVSDLQFIEQDMDGLSPDSFCFYGMAENGGLEIGGIDLLMGAHFMPGGVAEGEVKTLCVDTALVPSDGEWLFTDFLEQPIYPRISGGSEQCKPVKLLPCCEPYLIKLSTYTRETAVCRTEYFYATFLDYEEEPFYGELISCTGNGTVELGINGNNITMHYTPAQGDAGEIIIVTLRACNSSGCSEPYIHRVSVTGNAPTMDVGLLNNTAIADNLFVKGDLVIEDPNSCEILTYAVLSGPGEIDAEGLYTWVPTVGDQGTNHFVEVMATDEHDTVTGSFEIEVLPGEGLDGDANLDGSVNVGDIVFLINYVFKNGAFPQVPNLADVNSDCALNIGDAVYLIGYVFKHGPAPWIGCVY